MTSGAPEGRARRGRLVLVIGKAIVFVLYLVFLAYAVILGIAFFLRLFGANPSAEFADWIFRASTRIMEPFRGIFPTTQIGERSEFDASLLFAMVIYLVVAITLHGIVNWFTRRISRADVERERRRYWSTLATATPVTPAPAPAPATYAAVPPPATSTAGNSVASSSPSANEAKPPPTSIAPTIGDLPANVPGSAANGPVPGGSSESNAADVARSTSGSVGRVNPPVSPFPRD
jgi:uncharacterized protein YggT (Ycf19 family)